MKNGNISKILYMVILLILLVNAVTSTANVIEDDAILRRVIPAVCWSFAALIWTAAYFMKGQI
jgi:hypothetical protein